MDWSVLNGFRRPSELTTRDPNRCRCCLASVEAVSRETKRPFAQAPSWSLRRSAFLWCGGGKVTKRNAARVLSISARGSTTRLASTLRWPWLDLDGSFEWTASKWRRGSVDRASDHFELRHGSPNRRLMALLGHGLPGELVVEFLVGADDGVQSAAVADVRRELDFYLVEKKERDPWAYAQYHCTTAANIYSEVHWSFVAAGQSGPAGGEGLAQ